MEVTWIVVDQRCKSSLVHSAEGNDRTIDHFRQTPCLTGTEGSAVGMRPGWIKGTDEHKRGATPKRILSFLLMMDCAGNGQARTKIGIMGQIGGELLSQSGRPGDSESEMSRSCFFRNASTQPKAVSVIQAVVTKDDAAIAFRQAGDRMPQAIADALVSHQPAPWP